MAISMAIRGPGSLLRRLIRRYRRVKVQEERLVVD